MLTQTESQRDDAVFRLFLVNRIVVYAARHTAYDRIKPVVMALADHLLQDNGHFLLVYHVLRGRHIVFGSLEIHRCVDRLHRCGEHMQSVVHITHSRYHVRRINPCKRLIMRIFQQRRRPYGNRSFHHVKKSLQIILELARQAGFYKTVKQILIRKIIRQGNLI